MKVLFIAPLPGPVTGQSLACRILHDHLAASHEVRVVDFSKQHIGQVAGSVVRILSVLRTFLAVWRERRFADVIYLNVSQSIAGNIKDLILYLICFRELSRVVIHLHGGAGMKSIMASPVLGGINRWFISRLGGAIVLGESHVPIFAEALPRHRIHIVPNCVEDFLFVEPADVARKFEAAQPLRVLFLSNLAPGKGHEELLTAYASLNDEQRHAIRLDIAGAFMSEKQGRDFLRRIEGMPGVQYHGVVHGEDKRRLLAAAHVLCLPTYYPFEGQPISILEAYAAGCALITTDHSGIPDICTDGVNGFIIRPRSVERLRAALVKAVSDPAALEDIAARNLATARQLYRTPVFNDRLENVLAGVAAAADARGGRDVIGEPDVVAAAENVDFANRLR